MGIGAVTISAVSAITEPTAFPLALPSANSKKAKAYGRVSAIELPGGVGSLFANGMDPLRLIVDDSVLRAGVLAPNVDPASDLAATPTGSLASATLNLNAYTPANGDEIVAGNGYIIQFVTAIPSIMPTGGKYGQSIPSYYVQIGTTPADTLNNLNALLTAGAGKGLLYDYPSVSSDPSGWLDVTSLTAITIALAPKSYGVSGNQYQAYLKTGTWTGATFGSTGGTVGTVGYFAGGADGTGTAPEAGEYRYRHSYKRGVDNARSAVGQEATASQLADQNIDISNIYAPIDSDDIDFKRVWRTLDAAFTLFLVKDIEVANAAATDDVGNDALAKNEDYDSTIHRPWAAGHIHRVRHLAHYKGRWCGGGRIRAATYKAGVADVTNGSNQVSISGGYPTKEMEHRTFRITDGDADNAIRRTIIAVDEANQKLYLDETWTGTSSASAGNAYEILDDQNPYAVHYCEATLPNQTTGQMVEEGVQGPDAEGITGIVETYDGVVIFTRSGIWRLTGSEPESFRVTHEYEGVGCVAGGTVLSIDGILYWLGEEGFYSWTGQGEPVKISSPPEPGTGRVRGIQRTVDRINGDHAMDAFGHYDPERRMIRWFVPLDTDITCRHAICYDLNVGAWMLDHVPDMTCCASVHDPNGNLRTLAGDVFGNVWELDVSTTDGAYGFAPVQVVQSGADKDSFSVAATPLPTSGDGLKGVPVLLVDADGDVDRVTVSANTSSLVTLSGFLQTAPTSGIYAIFGGIHRSLLSGWFTLEDKGANVKIMEAVKVLGTYAASGEYWPYWAVDQGTPAVGQAEGYSAAQTDGEEHIWIRNWGRRLKFGLDSFTPGPHTAFQALQFWVRMRDSQRSQSG